jgi:hypothetical protein
VLAETAEDSSDDERPDDEKGRREDRARPEDIRATARTFTATVDTSDRNSLIRPSSSRAERRASAHAAPNDASGCTSAVNLENSDGTPME